MYRELARFCSRAHTIPFAVLCDGCNATRCLIETMENNGPLFFEFFFRFGEVVPFFTVLTIIESDRWEKQPMKMKSSYLFI